MANMAVRPGSRLSLRAQLYGLLAAIVVPMVGLLAYAGYSGYRAELRQGQLAAYTLAEITVGNTRQFLSDLERTMSRLSARPRIRALDPRRCDPALKDFLDIRPGFTNLGVIDREGVLICAAVPPPDGQTMRFEHREWFESAVRDGKFVVGEPQLSRISGRWVAAAAYPIRDEGGGVAGLLAMAIDLQTFAPLASSAKLGSEAVTAVLNSAGTIVARSDDVGATGRNARGAEVIDAVLRGRDGLTTGIGRDGVERVYGFKPIPGTDWFALAGIPSAVISSPFSSGVLRVVLIVALIVLAVIQIALLISRRIEQPIRAFAGAARAVSRGDLQARLVPEGAAETAALAGEFNGMIDAVLAAQRALREAEARYRTFVEVCPDGVFVVCEGRIVFANAAGCALLEVHSAEQLAGRNALKLFAPEYRDTILARGKRLLDTGTSNPPIDVRALRADGSPIDLEVRAAFLEHEGKPAMLTVARDITERKKAEAALQSSEEGFRRLWETSTDAVIVVSSDNVIEYASSPVELIFGYRPGEIVGRPLSLLQPQRLQSAHDRGFARYLQTQQRSLNWRATETVGLRRDGTEFPIEISFGEIEFAGRPMFAGFIRDNTTRKQTESALRASEQRFRALTENSSDAVALLSPDGRVLYSSPATTRVLGYPLEEFVGRSAFEFIHPEDQSRFIASLNEVAKSPGASVELDSRVRHRDGQWRIIEAVFTNLTHDQSIGAIVNNYRDVTERRRAAGEIRRLNAELERRVVQRTAQLEAANKELEAFSYSVSHDLRAPLRAIDGFSHAVLDNNGAQLDDTGRNYLNRVRAATQRMSQMIDDILNLSRITREDIRRERLDLADMAKRMVEELRESEPQRRVDFVTHDGMVAEGDRHLLERALDNLIRNAWKYTSKQPHARIEFGLLPPGAGRPGDRVFFLKDNGAGFDMKYVGKLFGAFQRLHGAQEFPGNGIGLVTVQRIVQRHGGRIWAEGEPGRGAVFYFTLA
jgi:PAS domain S-box-containing protein